MEKELPISTKDVMASPDGQATALTLTESRPTQLINTTPDRPFIFRLKLFRMADIRISGWALIASVFIWSVCFGYSTGLARTRSEAALSNSSSGSQQWTPIATTEKELVPFEAHIMSKCPDAEYCLRKMILPAMQIVESKVNFTLSYIGTPTANDGVECMHGAPECMGNILELCAAHLYPDPKIYLGFTMCLSRDYKEIPERSLVEDCALEHGLDFDKLNRCASTDDDGGEGMKMLRDSVTRSSDAHVTTSCTVRVNEEIYCIRDGGQWKDCKHGPGVNDLVIAIQKLYSS